MEFKRQSKFSFSSCNHTEFFPIHIEQNQPNPLQQDSPIPSLTCEQTLWQPTPGPSGTQWSEDLFRGKQPKFHLISTFDSSELTLPPFVEPSQTNEPPIPGWSPSSEPHEDVLTHDPEPEVALRKSMEEPFAHPTPPHSVIIINNKPIGSTLPFLHPLLPRRFLPFPLRTQPPPPPSAKLPSFPQ
ncbi:hypothetical protein O181_073954 [Austropuccinia psidii MF-1]|uniref:Uncharacterized protein n=1 Tax=Austropuccinia psidii MF-1 TaxID=1389203 RepID=A0A9Q3F7Q8_9BASI|nr:hypothetical protein [Austropuccinia psidii MF-1]